MVHVEATCTIPQTAMYKGIEGSHGIWLHVFARKLFLLCNLHPMSLKPTFDENYA